MANDAEEQSKQNSPKKPEIKENPKPKMEKKPDHPFGSLINNLKIQMLQQKASPMKSAVDSKESDILMRNQNLQTQNLKMAETNIKRQKEIVDLQKKHLEIISDFEESFDELADDLKKISDKVLDDNKSQEQMKVFIETLGKLMMEGLEVNIKDILKTSISENKDQVNNSKNPVGDILSSVTSMMGLGAGKSLKNLATKSGAFLKKAGPKALKFAKVAGPVGLALGAGMAGYEGFKMYQRTGKASTAITGALGSLNPFGDDNGMAMSTSAAFQIGNHFGETGFTEKDKRNLNKSGSKDQSLEKWLSDPSFKKTAFNMLAAQYNFRETPQLMPGGKVIIGYGSVFDSMDQLQKSFESIKEDGNTFSSMLEKGISSKEATALMNNNLVDIGAQINATSSSRSLSLSTALGLLSSGWGDPESIQKNSILEALNTGNFDKVSFDGSAYSVSRYPEKKAELDKKLLSSAIKDANVIGNLFGGTRAEDEYNLYDKAGIANTKNAGGFEVRKFADGGIVESEVNIGEVDSKTIIPLNKKGSDFITEIFENNQEVKSSVSQESITNSFVSALKEISNNSTSEVSGSGSIHEIIDSKIVEAFNEFSSGLNTKQQPRMINSNRQTEINPFA